MEAITSFSSRRAAASGLPAFTLPPPNSDIPSMPFYPHQPSSSRPSSSHYSTTSGLLTPSSGVSDGLSPSMSSVNTASSQGSQAPSMQYTYGSHVQGAWPTPGNSSYHISSASQSQPLGQSPYGGRQPMYSQSSNMSFQNPRTSGSPATGEGLPPPPFDQVHQPFHTPISGASGHQDHHHALSSAQQPQSNMMSPHNSSQAPGQSNVAAHVDSYSHTRAPSNSYYTSSAAPQQSFSSYAPHQSPPQHSPTSAGPRGLGSLSGQQSAMAPPAQYRQYQSYQQLPGMGGPVMSNMHQPGSQMSMIPAMGVPQGYGGQLMYGHSQPQPQSERPFKCDQCVQSFSRNHDLKRHKRIHLAVKPFPCSFCTKSFSRKDALKRHRLVKGCESKGHEGAAAHDHGTDHNDDDEHIKPE